MVVGAQSNNLDSLLELYPEESQTVSKPLELFTANSKKRIGIIAGEPYTVQREDGRWLRVKFLRPAVPLWVSAEFVKVSGNLATVTASTLNVRLTPSRRSVIVTTVPFGYSSPVLESRDGFIQIKAPSTTEVSVVKDGWSLAKQGSTAKPNLVSTRRNTAKTAKVENTKPIKRESLASNTAAVVPEKAESKKKTVQVDDVVVQGDSQHLLSPGDAISVRVFGEPDLSTENLRVPASGLVSFPLIGSVEVGGKTTKQIEANVINILSQGYVNNPRVSVSIFSYRPIFIRGAVRSPGSFPYTEGLSIAKVLALAGGSKNSAKADGVSILRDGETVASGLNLDSQYIVSSGDVITLEEVLGVGEDSQLFIYLHGEVASPGAYIYRRDLTVEKAIVLAGGFTLRGSKKKIKVTRYNGVPENEEPIRLRGVKLYTTIKPGDVIDVGARWF